MRIPFRAQYPRLGLASLPKRSRRRGLGHHGQTPSENIIRGCQLTDCLSQGVSLRARDHVLQDGG